MAFIDWDCAGPVEPVVAFAAAAWEFVPLAPPELLRGIGLRSCARHRSPPTLFADAYGIADRRAVVPALRHSRLLTAGRVRYAPLTPAEAAENLEFRARELRWLRSVVPILDRGLAR